MFHTVTIFKYHFELILFPCHPLLPLTASTEVELRLFRNSLSDVDLGPKTCHTHVGRVRLNRCTTLATKTGEGTGKKILNR